MATKSKYNPLLKTGFQEVYDENSPVVYQVEDFINSTLGNCIGFQSFTTAGGSIASEIWESQPNYNSTIPRARKGQSSVRITTAPNSSAGIFSGQQYRLSASERFAYSAEFSIVGGQVNRTTDNVFQCIGFDQGTFGNGSSGFFVRPPIVGEINTMKIIIKVAGFDTIFETSIGYDATNRRFCKVYIEWDGFANKLIFKIYDDNNVNTISINNVSTLFPALISNNYNFCIGQGRSFTATTPIARNINVDKIERWHLSKNFKD